MNRHFVLAVVIAALPSATSNAGFPAKTKRKVFNSRPAAKRMTSQKPARIDMSPEKLTERFGPSILVRETARPTKAAKFVTQPK